jgi:hypothetical protein
MESQFAGRDIKKSALLREPLDHFISHYNFRMMRYIAAGQHPYGFALAYRARQRNFITHHILKNFLALSWAAIARLSDDEKYDIVNAFLATFWYVGDYKLCDDLIAGLATDLGIPSRAQPTNTRVEWEVRVKWKALQLSDFSPDAIARFRQDNLLDQKLWETWRQARHETGSVRPLALGGRSTRSFITSEATRFVNQIARRIQRRWGLFRV